MTSRYDRTHAAIQRAAITLMSTRGFAAVPVAAVAEAAGVTEMTVFRHFATKEELVLDDPYDPLIGAAVTAQPRSLPPVARAARALRTAWAQLPDAAEAESRERIRIVVAEPRLRARMAINTERTRDAIASALVEDGTDRVVAMIAASACLAAITAGLLDWGSTVIAAGKDPEEQGTRSSDSRFREHEADAEPDAPDRGTLPRLSDRVMASLDVIDPEGSR